MSTSALVTTVVGASALAWLTLVIFRVGRREPDLPPGPPTLPILGNLHVFPTVRMHIKFTEWAGTYGDIFSLKLVNGTVTVLNSLEAVWHVLEKQSNRTSNRPPSTIARMVADDLHFPTLNADTRWKSYHRAARIVLSPSAAERHKPIIEAEICQLLYEFLTEPEGFFDHARRSSMSISLSIVCGKRAPRNSIPFAKEFYRMVPEWLRLLESGAALDLVPALTYLPEILAPWKAKVRKLRPWMHELYMSTVKDCEEREAKGTSNGCALETVRENAEDWGLTRSMIGFLGGVLVEAGSDTSALSMHNMILMAMVHPEAQQRAHEEIDRVVGSDRLPGYSDLDRMPYVKAFILEVSRLKPTAPLGFAHAASADTMYKGYRIPKGSMIFMNYWSISRDPNLFDDADKFMPERYLEHPQGFGKAIRTRATQSGLEDDESLKLWPNVVFGAGKRKCPGMYLAENVLHLATMRLLWAFSFDKPKDSSGRDVHVDIWNDKPGVLGAPFPFDCNIHVRSPKHAALINQSYRDSASIFQRFEQELGEADRQWYVNFRSESVDWRSQCRVADYETDTHATVVESVAISPSLERVPAYYFPSAFANFILQHSIPLMSSRRIIIIGGNGKIAKRLTKMLVSANPPHRVTSIIRSPSQVDSIKALSPELVTPLVLSLETSQSTDYARIFEETAADVVYFIAGGSGKPGENGESVVERTRKVDFDGAIMIYDALEAVSGKKPRLIMISALDIRAPDAPFPDHYDEADRALSARIRVAHPAYYEWKYKADKELVERTGFKWTLVRPGGLTEEPGAGTAAIGRTHLTSRISRDDVAQVLFYLLDREDSSGLAIDVAGGVSDIKVRLDEVIAKGESDFPL